MNKPELYDDVKIYSFFQARKLLGVSDMVLKLMIKKGNIDYIFHNGRYKFNLKMLRELHYDSQK